MRMKNTSFFFDIRKMALITLFLSLPAQAKTVVATYYSSGGNSEAIGKIPAKQLSHVLYAFIALCGNNEGADKSTQQAIKKACKGKSDFSAVLYNEQQAIDELNAFKQLKKQHPHLILLPSFGGWSLSKPFHEMAKKAAFRQHFVKSAVTLIEKNDVFDGIDIDWEFPGGGGNSHPVLSGAAAKQEKDTFRLMMKEFRAELDALTAKTNRQYQLTAAVNGSAPKTDAIDWKNTIPYMDYVFTMTYDFAVGDGQAGHHTSLFSVNKNTLSTENMINNLLTAGVPASKLVVGVAFYGRGWVNSGWNKTHFDNQNNATSTGSYTYQELIDKPPEGYQYGYDESAQAAYFYNPHNDGFISFDNTRTIKAKAKWIKKLGLAGLFSWQVRQDNGELIDAMFDHMKTKD